jgi:hypothetical protein
MSSKGDRTRVKVTQSDDGIQINLIGRRALKYDARLIEQCANAIVDCAETNACLDRGLQLTDKCFETLVAHDKKADCMTKGFGLSTRKA